MMNALAYNNTEFITTIKSFIQDPRVGLEVTDTDKHTSLLQSSIDYNNKQAPSLGLKYQTKKEVCDTNECPSL